MRNRTRSRQLALQFLYQYEYRGQEARKYVDEFLSQISTSEEEGEEPISDEVKEFFVRLIDLTIKHQEEIDKLIESCADHWRIDRMAVVDRNIIRLGSAEILYCDDIPDKVAINESIELAKDFGDSESWRFVNGILDHVAKKHAEKK